MEYVRSYDPRYVLSEVYNNQLIIAGDGRVCICELLYMTIWVAKLMYSAEGPFTCSNATIQNNDIGPCGSDAFQEVFSYISHLEIQLTKQWADGISLSCQSSLVQNNVIVDATDGGIVIFGAPFSVIRNNTIGVKTRTTLGGINCTSPKPQLVYQDVAEEIVVDVLPWAPPGNYSHTEVSGNRINGGFATGVSPL